MQTVLNNRKVDLSEITVNNTKLLTTLENCYIRKNRIRVFYGDINTGISWNDEHDVIGAVSTSTGDVACLILVNNSRSYGGGALLDSAIIRIDDIKTKKTLYKHELFKVALLLKGNEILVNKNDGGLFAKFDNALKAKRTYDFLNGLRYSK